MQTAMLCGVKISVNYTRCTLPDFNARAETQTFLGSPSTKIVTFCRLAPKRRFVLFIALERELTFVGWGQTLLSDFSEIDHYLVQPEKIFPYIHALKEAEHWSGADELTEMQKKHLAFWNTLGDYYFALNEKLVSQKKGYSGLIARKAVEFLPHYIQNNTNKIHIFVGFNALSKAEQKVIQSILTDLPSEIYWDIDEKFVKKKEHDAGLFIRKYINSWRYYDSKQREPKWLSNNYDLVKEINITGVPKSINQAHSVAELLEKFSQNELEKTALIIADENLLIPVLQAVKPNTSVNITMGYPLKQTPLNDLFATFFRLHLSKKFYYKDVLLQGPRRCARSPPPPGGCSGRSGRR